MSETANEALAVARAMVAAARAAGYWAEDEPMRSSPELAALEKPLFVKMFQALREHLQKAGRMELSEDEIASLFNFAVGRGAEQAYNFLSGQKQDCNTIGMFDARVSLYVDDRLMNFLKATPIAPTLGGAFVDFQHDHPGDDPILALFEALKWTMRITAHLALTLMENWHFQSSLSQPWEDTAK